MYSVKYIFSYYLHIMSTYYLHIMSTFTYAHDNWRGAVMNLFLSSVVQFCATLPETTLYMQMHGVLTKIECLKNLLPFRYLQFKKGFEDSSYSFGIP